METVTIHTAKITLPQLLASVEVGEESVLARGKHLIARLVPFHPQPASATLVFEGDRNGRFEILRPAPGKEIGGMGVKS